jgi:hypothetical protein
MAAAESTKTASASKDQQKYPNLDKQDCKQRYE